MCFNGCVILAVTHSLRCPQHHFRTQHTSSRPGLLNIHYALRVWTGPNKPQRRRLSTRLFLSFSFFLFSPRLHVVHLTHINPSCPELLFEKRARSRKVKVALDWQQGSSTATKLWQNPSVLRSEDLSNSIRFSLLRLQRSILIKIFQAWQFINSIHSAIFHRFQQSHPPRCQKFLLIVTTVVLWRDNKKKKEEKSSKEIITWLCHSMTSSLGFGNGFQLEALCPSAPDVTARWGLLSCCARRRQREGVKTRNKGIGRLREELCVN